MACTDDRQQLTFKHYCRVCKKGFMCGRALGGHMRAHGIGDENGNLDDDDDDQASDWEEKHGGSDRPNNKRMYQLRTNPNRLKSCRICQNCGKEFLSWKCFLEHGKCSSEDASESFLSSPESEGEDNSSRHGGGWSKRKRSLRTKAGTFSPNYSPSEEDDLLLARCLVQLANTTVDPPLMEPEESSTSASKGDERRQSMPFFSSKPPFDKAKGTPSPKGLFECKACKKVFNSHQALGGHRASHKKVKGCYAAKQDQQNDTSFAEDDVITEEDQLFPSKSTSSFQFGPSSPLVGAAGGPSSPLVGAARRKAKVHECSICHRVFASGQALGGHKRCHWITSNGPEPSTLSKFQFQDQTESPNGHQKPKVIYRPDTLDLNVPAWAHESGIRQDPRNPLSFDVPTDMPVDSSPTGHSDRQLKVKNETDGNNNNTSNTMIGDKINIDNKIDGLMPQNVDDEADSSPKLTKFSDLNDLKGLETSGSSSQWLQVGIGPAPADGKS